VRFAQKELAVIAIGESVLLSVFAVVMWNRLPAASSYHRLLIIIGSFALIVVVGLATRAVTTRRNNRVVVNTMRILAFLAILAIMRRLLGIF
jgi:hypothetical protein